jgi:YidC/Oxa1 family membrane protein insertase
MDFLTNPFISAILALYQILGQNIVLTIVIFTVLTRVLTYPLTYQQVKSSRKMQEVGPKLNRLKEKYKNDREKLAQAQMQLYKEEGINPLAGCLPLVIQLPILFGLYGAIQAALASTPLQILDLYHRLMIPSLSSLVPLQRKFLWLDLSHPDPTMLLPIIVVATTWLQSKLMTPPTADPKDPSAAMSRNMTLMMPLMIGLFSLSFASGLSIYWIVSNLVGIAQYALVGKKQQTLAVVTPNATIEADDDDVIEIPKKKNSLSETSSTSSKNKRRPVAPKRKATRANK